MRREKAMGCLKSESGDRRGERHIWRAHCSGVFDCVAHGVQFVGCAKACPREGEGEACAPSARSTRHGARSRASAHLRRWVGQAGASAWKSSPPSSTIPRAGHRLIFGQTFRVWRERVVLKCRWYKVDVMGLQRNLHRRRPSVMGRRTVYPALTKARAHRSRRALSAATSGAQSAAGRSRARSRWRWPPSADRC